MVDLRVIENGCGYKTKDEEENNTPSIARPFHPSFAVSIPSAQKERSRESTHVNRQ